MSQIRPTLSAKDAPLVDEALNLIAESLNYGDDIPKSILWRRMLRMTIRVHKSESPQRIKELYQ